MLNSAVLLLNQNYEPLTTCSARRAITMVWLGKAEIVETTGIVVRSISHSMHIPAIIRLLFFVGMRKHWNITLSKQNILRRDRKTCQYCGSREGPMTVDHIIPRSLGGEDTWSNLVCACAECNNIKGNRTPIEAGMTLLQLPRKPNVRAFLFHSRDPVHRTWRTYLNLW